MKIWLNDLKEGDIFYQIMLHRIFKCKHLGDAANPHFKMPRIKFEIIDDDQLCKLMAETFGNIHEAFVNQYVFDNFDEAEEELRKQCLKDLENLQLKIIDCEKKLSYFKDEAETIKKVIEEYDKKHNKENITES